MEGAAGDAVEILTAKVCGLLLPQELPAVTVIFPPVAEPDVCTVIVVVPAPLVTVHPDGKFQV